MKNFTNKTEEQKYHQWYMSTRKNIWYGVHLYNLAQDTIGHHKIVTYFRWTIYQVVWSWNLRRFGLYFAYNVSILSDADSNLDL
jgi:hypothetical protein